MRQASNFRLDETVINTINVLAKDLHTTKTNVIEEAVMQYAGSLKTKRNALLQFAGSLDAGEADIILEGIQRDKNSKDIDLGL
jgi:predicted transcriptional regulator